MLDRVSILPLQCSSKMGHVPARRRLPSRSSLTSACSSSKQWCESLGRTGGLVPPRCPPKGTFPPVIKMFRFPTRRYWERQCCILVHPYTRSSACWGCWASSAWWVFSNNGDVEIDAPREDPVGPWWGISELAGCPPREGAMGLSFCPAPPGLHGFSRMP